MSEEDKIMKPYLRCCSFQPVTHCIFELDGLLIDSERLRTECVQKILDPYGHTYSFDIRMRCMGKPDAEQAELIVNTYNLPFSRTEFETQQELQSRSKLGFIRLMPGVERLLKHLDEFNVPMAIGSGSCRDSFATKTRRHSRLFDVFHHVVLSGSDEEVKEGKPAPDIFLTTASRFEDPPEPSKCLVFESSLAGMEAALAAGMQVVLVPDPLVSIRASAPATLRLRSLEGFKPQYFGLPPL
ncbi:probable pseudouridine-5'-phosphatase [Drosophila gunungcola]|uniref:probable pseudouridine-5'-phosphatase n=1 Tax=Drosophila gunungcola TaxID=103775 RepID=UPI0022E6DF75|nr:probable pseudouridine-5'-phosphatase [Drosophila gunungcola]